MSAGASMLLHAGIDNALSQLGRVVAAYASGELTEAHHPHAIGVLFRKLGVCRLLTTGRAAPLWRAQMQGVSAYLHRLPEMPEADTVTSRAGVLWDAIGGGYWGAAAEIARHSRATFNPAWEHEDDFLYVWFLMVRYLLGGGRGLGEGRQRALLERWDAVLDGGYDPRRLLCEALLRGDGAGFHAALEEVGDAREASLSSQVAKGRVPREDAVWVLPVWLEGLALVRLAEREGVVVEHHVRGVPQVLREQSGGGYDGEAWRG